jgi:hypothetical protein
MKLKFWKKDPPPPPHVHTWSVRVVTLPAFYARSCACGEQQVSPVPFEKEEVKDEPGQLSD